MDFYENFKNISTAISSFFFLMKKQIIENSKVIKKSVPLGGVGGKIHLNIWTTWNRYYMVLLLQNPQQTILMHKYETTFFLLAKQLFSNSTKGLKMLFKIAWILPGRVRGNMKFSIKYEHTVKWKNIHSVEKLMEKILDFFFLNKNQILCVRTILRLNIMQRVDCEVRGWGEFSSFFSFYSGCE